MTELIIKRKNNSYKRLLITSPVALFIIIRSFIHNLTSDREWKLVILIIIGLLGCMCTAFLINTIIRVLKKTPALVINQEGLYDDVSLAKTGLLTWENIDSYKIENYMNASHLFIYLKDFSHILSKQRRFKKQMIEILVKDRGTPVAINLSLIDFDVSELIAIIEKYKA